MTKKILTFKIRLLQKYLEEARMDTRAQGQEPIFQGNTQEQITNALGGEIDIQTFSGSLYLRNSKDLGAWRFFLKVFLLTCHGLPTIPNYLRNFKDLGFWKIQTWISHLSDADRCEIKTGFPKSCFLELRWWTHYHHLGNKVGILSASKRDISMVSALVVHL